MRKFIPYMLFVCLILSGVSHALAACTPLNDWVNKNINVRLPDVITVTPGQKGNLYHGEFSIVSVEENLVECSPETRPVVNYTRPWRVNESWMNTPAEGVRMSVWFIKRYIRLLTPSYGKSSATDIFIPSEHIEINFATQADSITSGKITPGTLASYGYEGAHTAFFVNLINEVNIVSTCEVTNKNINVAMPATNTGDFRGQGSASSESAFDVQLNCATENAVSVNIETGSAGAIDPSQGILALQDSGGEGVASGVGIQVLYDGKPVELGKAFDAGSVVVGNNGIPFKARYLQIGEKVTAGKADSNATFTLTYH
ncbi:hypothetical protein C1N60_02525 [Pantoea sp. SGAir0184]